MDEVAMDILERGLIYADYPIVSTVKEIPKERSEEDAGKEK